MQLAQGNGSLHNAGPAGLSIEEALIQTVAYVDIFDYPLKVAEIHRYLKGYSATREQVEQALTSAALVPGHLSVVDGYYTLPGREAIIETRRRRKAVADLLWPLALQYGYRIAAAPFVRMVAVSGSLAVDNADEDADIDYFVICRPGRVWLSRAFVILIVRLAAGAGVRLCPNYILSAEALAFGQQTLYAAHELAQLVLIAGRPVYDRLREENKWSEGFLPNAGGLPRHTTLASLSWSQRRFRQASEALLATRLGSRLESWEMKRKISKFQRMMLDGSGTEAAFCADWCKGHFDSHGQKTLSAFDSRLSALGEG